MILILINSKVKNDNFLTFLKNVKSHNNINDFLWNKNEIFN
jgi:hypothetical protein